MRRFLGWGLWLEKLVVIWVISCRENEMFGIYEVFCLFFLRESLVG